jgi:hypothetical protein
MHIYGIRTVCENDGRHHSQTSKIRFASTLLAGSKKQSVVWTSGSSTDSCIDIQMKINVVKKPTIFFSERTK